MALDHSISGAERHVAEAKAHPWYLKSSEVWDEWNRRGACTPESEIERHKVERLLKAMTPAKTQQPQTVQPKVTQAMEY